MTYKTTCLSPYPIFPIGPMTGHATRFDPANPATEHTPAECGEESPRSCTRWKTQRRRERGRPRPHQPDDRSCTCFNHANPTTEHRPVGGGQECPRSCTRWKRQRRRERGRPRPHQRDDRPYDQLGSRKSCARTFPGWGCTNNVPVPISASEGYLRRLRQPRIGTRDNLQRMPQSGGKTQITSLSLYPTHPQRSCCWDRLSFCQRKRYGEAD